MAKDTSQRNQDLFVIMPFSGTKSCTEQQWTEIFKDVFSPAAKEAGLECSRAKVGTGSLIKSIVERLKTSFIVLADITDLNPNVFYELGVRHSLSKRTIIVAQAANHIPSDLRGYWSLIYGTSPGKVIAFKEAFRDIVQSIRSAPDASDNPVADYLEREFVQGSRQMNLDIARKLSALHTELTGIEVTLLNTNSNPPQNSLTLPACLSLLLETRYIDPGTEILALGYETRDVLRHIAGSGFQGPLVASAKIAVSTLKVRIGEIRQKISTGTYVEPEQLSIMEWSVPSKSVQQTRALMIPERPASEEQTYIGGVFCMQTSVLNPESRKKLQK